MKVEMPAFCVEKRQNGEISLLDYATGARRFWYNVYKLLCETLMRRERA